MLGMRLTIEQEGAVLTGVDVDLTEMRDDSLENFIDTLKPALMRIWEAKNAVHSR